MAQIVEGIDWSFELWSEWSSAIDRARRSVSIAATRQGLSDLSTVNLSTWKGQIHEPSLPLVPSLQSGNGPV